MVDPTARGYCSFCGKRAHEVFKIVAGPGSVGICDECIVLVTDVVAEARKPPEERAPSLKAQMAERKRNRPVPFRPRQ